MREPGRLATSLLAGVLALPITHAWRERRRPLEEPDRTSVAWQTRQDALRRARVFAYSTGNIGAVDFSKSPHDGNPLGLDEHLVTCRYVPKPTKATSPKFDCELPGGDVIKVKYDTLEIQAEVAATRLLAALGFGVDHVMLVERLRCQGCPRDPFHTRRALEYFSASFLLDRFVDASSVRDFEWVSVERRIPGRAFELDEFGGWHVNELDQIDPAKGGAARADVDALRLIALLVGHWDNKLDNQRLVCREEPGGEDSDHPCRRPLLVIHDLGATFGMRRVDLPTWQALPIWADGPGCRGGPFVPAEITEEGRRLTAARLRQLSRSQLTTLFRAARFPDPATGAIPAADVTPWVDAFLSKVAEIADRAPCPGRTATAQTKGPLQ
jgi:hypothetical protein